MELQRLQMKMQKWHGEQEQSPLEIHLPTHQSHLLFFTHRHYCAFHVDESFQQFCKSTFYVEVKTLPHFLFFSRLAAANHLPSSDPILFLFSHKLTSWPCSRHPYISCSDFLRLSSTSESFYGYVHKFKPPPQCATDSLLSVTLSKSPATWCHRLLKCHPKKVKTWRMQNLSSAVGSSCAVLGNVG